MDSLLQSLAGLSVCRSKTSRLGEQRQISDSTEPILFSRMLKVSRGTCGTVRKFEVYIQPSSDLELKSTGLLDNVQTKRVNHTVQLKSPNSHALNHP